MKLKLSNRPNPRRICLIGKMRSGKDTLGRYLCNTHGYHRYAFGDELKRYYNEIFRSSVIPTTKPRQGLQWFGQAMRQHEPDVWVRKMFEKINTEQPARIVVTDCRQPNEYERLVREGFVMVRILCDEITRIERMERASDVFTLEDLRHETEIALDDCPVHFTVNNLGTVDEMIADFERQFKFFKKEVRRSESV